MIASASKWQPYLALVRSTSAGYGVAPELVLGIMQAESNFDPAAYRDEPQLRDASRGLMQLLLTTARGLGFAGQPSELFDPAKNISLGTKLISLNLAARGGDVGKALSMYNGGYRPALGFGEPLATGKFRNQTYVDRVLGSRDEFAKALYPSLPPSTGNGGTGPGPLQPAGDSSMKTAVIVAAVVTIGAALVALFRGR